MIDYLNLIEKCETLIRDGQGQRVASYLTHLRLGDIPREHCLPLANICRRAGLLVTGIKILGPFTRPENKLVAPKPGELAEYAVLLERCGAVKEALGILQVVDTEVAPEALLYRVFCHFKSWEYGAAVGDLFSYIKSAQSPYAKLVGQVNLAAAYVVEGKYEVANDLLDQNVELADQHGFARLKGNCFELKAQTEFYRDDFRSMRRHLSEAERIFTEDGTLDQFFVSKWLSVLKAFETRDPGPLLELRLEAQKRKDWETMREADLFRLKVRFDEEAFEHLYFGTPFEASRRRITNYLEQTPRHDHIVLGRGRTRILDLKTGEISGAKFNAGKQLHRFLNVLLQDFYRPLRLGGIFAEVFQDERFDGYSSPTRVHQLLFRLRSWLQLQDIPVAILENDRTYSLEIQGDFAFKISLDAGEASQWAPYWNRLEARLSLKSEVSPSEIRGALDLKLTTSKRFIKWAVESGKLERLGANNQSRYRRCG